MKSLAIPATLLALSVPAAHGATILSDSFDGSSFNSSLWTYGAHAGTASANVSGGSITIDNGINSTSNRAALVSTTTSANPFVSPVTISLSGISLTSTSTAATTVGYVILGREETDIGGAASATLAKNYSSTSGASYDGSGAIALNFFRNNVSGVYTVNIIDLGTNSTTTTWTLSGAPTDISWTLDGTGVANSYSFSVVGATITARPGSDTGTNSSIGTGSWAKDTRFGASDLVVGESSFSRIAIGSINAGALTLGSSSVFGLSGITVTDTSAIPEPSSFALLASAFVGGLTIARRRRR